MKDNTGQEQNNLPPKVTVQLGKNQVQIIVHSLLEQFWGQTEGRKSA